jgi:hypothetical protein
MVELVLFALWNYDKKSCIVTGMVKDMQLSEKYKQNFESVASNSLGK